MAKYHRIAVKQVVNPNLANENRQITLVNNVYFKAVYLAVQFTRTFIETEGLIAKRKTLADNRLKL